MAVKDGYLTCVYNLGGGDGEVRVQSLVTQSKTEEAVMDQVTFERYKTHSIQQSSWKPANNIFN